jgi:hypothetical protein
MRQSLQFPMKLKSENLIRGVNKFAIYGQHEAQREKVKALLTKHIAKPPEVVRGESNRFIVTLCRISAGFLDSEDNLTGAFKHVRDAVGRWLGFRNDANDRLKWKYQQQECPPKNYLIRITIDDDAEGDEREIVVGDSPEWLGAISEGCERAKSAKRRNAKGDAKPQKDTTSKRAGQAALSFRKAFVVYPWDVPAGGDEDAIVATELRQYSAVEQPPKQFQARIPREHVDRMLRRFGTAVKGLGPGLGPRLVFERSEHEDPALGGSCWLYMPVEVDEAAKV